MEDKKHLILDGNQCIPILDDRKHPILDLCCKNPHYNSRETSHNHPIVEDIMHLNMDDFVIFSLYTER